MSGRPAPGRTTRHHFTPSLHPPSEEPMKPPFPMSALLCLAALAGSAMSCGDPPAVTSPGLSPVLPRRIAARALGPTCPPARPLTGDHWDVQRVFHAEQGEV